jgi:hypothetical protein
LEDIHPARRNGEAVLTTRAGLDVETKLLDRRAKLPPLGRDVNPYDQNTHWREEVHKPVQCGLKRLDRMLSPLNKCDVVLTTGKFAGCRRDDARKAEAMQLKTPVGLVRTCQYDSLPSGTLGELDHRAGNSIGAIWRASGHDQSPDAEWTMQEAPCPAD